MEESQESRAAGEKKQWCIIAMLVWYLPAVKSVVLEQSDQECWIYYVDGCQRKQNEPYKNVMQLCTKLITEVIENRD